jgi:pyruvate dehydrogenase (quinone)
MPGLFKLGERLKAPVVHTMPGKEHVEWDSPYDVGMTGLTGFTSSYCAKPDCESASVVSSSAEVIQ